VRRKDFVPSNSAVLCSLHFREEDIDRTSLCQVRIRENAVPSIFPAETVKKARKASKKRLLPSVVVCQDVPQTVNAMNSTAAVQSSLDHSLPAESSLNTADFIKQVNVDHCYTNSKMTLDRKLS
jgi:hypothetical protein